MSRTIPSCNRSFIIESLLQNKRIDGRSLHQFRDLQVNFGQTFGSCYVQLGHTVIFATTEAVVDEPRVTRPAEGRFKTSVNIAAGGKERWLRQLERSQPKEGVVAMRMLEKIINRISVLDLESLCLVVGKAVWCVHTKLVLLNFDGNLIEASSIAAIASLMHFRRPDATVTPDGVVLVHSLEERQPIALTIFHYPVCVTFQFMDHTLLKRILAENQENCPSSSTSTNPSNSANSGFHEGRLRKSSRLMICDPTEEEEELLRSVLIVCANTYREIVAIQSLGRISIASFASRILRDCAAKAFDRAEFVTNYLKSQLAKHLADRDGDDENEPREKIPSLQRTTTLFHRAMQRGELCIVRDYRRNAAIFGDRNQASAAESIVGANRSVHNIRGTANQQIINDYTSNASNAVTSDEDEEEAEQVSKPGSVQTNTSAGMDATEISQFLRKQRQAAQTIGRGGLSKWGLDVRQEDTDFDQMNVIEEEEGDDDKEEVEVAKHSSYASRIVQNLPPTQAKSKSQPPIRAAQTTSIVCDRNDAVAADNDHKSQIAMSSGKNEWIKVQNSGGGSKQQPDLSKLTKTQRKRMIRKLKNNPEQQQQSQKLKANLKIAQALTFEEEEEDEGEIVSLKSHFQK